MLSRNWSPRLPLQSTTAGNEVPLLNINKIILVVVVSSSIFAAVQIQTIQSTQTAQGILQAAQGVVLADQVKNQAALVSRFDLAGIAAGISLAIFAGLGNLVNVLEYFDNKWESSKKKNAEAKLVLDNTKKEEAKLVLDNTKKEEAELAQKKKA